MRGADFEARLLSRFADLDEACQERLGHAARWSVVHASVLNENALEDASGVARLVADLHLDCDAVCAAIIYMTGKKCQPARDDLETQFGAEIAGLCSGLEKMEMIHGLRSSATENSDRHESSAEGLRKMLLAMASDIRIVVIKLAERAIAVRNIRSLPEDRQKSLANEIMDIFAPLANRLGIWQLKWEMEDIAFRCLEPQQYQKIARHLGERRADRELYLERFMKDLGTALAAEGIAAELSGRPKHIYSIWKKMKRKSLSFNDLFDVRGIRVLVRNIHDCYAALGTVHTRWQHIPGEFDDYIATPKENDYQSLHTAVIGPSGKIVEVQIRTNEMHERNELGVAAHWRYKEDVSTDQAYLGKIAWIRQLLEWKDDIADAGDLAAHLRSELQEDRVYVFTPQGRVVDLPSGATPIDFAYQIHSEIGHRCRGAKINGRIVTLTQPLTTGDQVSILTARNGGPSRDWLNPHLGYVKSRRTRSKIRQYFRQLDFSGNVAAGRDLVERELQRLGLRNVSYTDMVKRLHYRDTEEFFAAIGRGDIRPGQIVRELHLVSTGETEDRGIAKPKKRRKSTGSGSASVTVKGVGDLLTHLANCCKPVPGDKIRGYITRGRGITVHRSDCGNLLRYEYRGGERLVDVNWGDRDSGIYPVDILVRAVDRQGLLRDVTTVFADCEINVVGAQTETNRKTHIANMRLTVEIGGLEELQKALSKIGRLSNVIEARRLTQ